MPNRARPKPSRQERAAPPPAKPPLPADVLRRLYAAMVQCRHAGSRLRGRPGCEAIWAATLLDLRDGDRLLLERAHLSAAVLRGSTLSDLARAHAGSAIPGATVLPASDVLALATGFSLAPRQPNQANVLLGSAASFSRPSDCLRLAAARKSGLVLVVYDARPLRERQLALRAQALGVASVTVEAGDAVAVYRVASEALDRARYTGAPTVIECRVWRGGDPLSLHREYLSRFGLWDQQWEDRLRADVATAFHDGQATALRAVSHRADAD